MHVNCIFTVFNSNGFKDLWRHRYYQVMPKKNTKELQSEKKTESNNTADNVDNKNDVVADAKKTIKKDTTKKVTAKKVKQVTQDSVNNTVTDSKKETKKKVKNAGRVATGTDKKDSVNDTQTGADKLEKNDDKVQEHGIVDGVGLKFKSQLPMCKDIINELSEKVKHFKQHMKKLESAYKQDVKKVSKTKRKRKGNNDPTGFIKTHPVPDKLAKYIGVDNGTELSGPDVTKKVWAAIKNKGLQYEKDGRVLRTNKETNDVFGLDNTVNKSTDHNDKDGFNFRNIQKYISYALHNK